MTSAFKAFDARIGFRFIKGKGQDIYEDDFYVEGWATSEAIDFEDDVFDHQAMEAMADGLLRSPTVFYNHYYDIPIGKVVEAEVKQSGENGFGVWVKAFISDSAIVPQTGQSIRQLVSEGVLSGFSVGGRLIQTALEFSEELGRKVRRILEFLIYEVSVVGIPCNRTARIMEWYVRSYREIAESSGTLQDVKNLDEIKQMAATAADFVTKGQAPPLPEELVEEAETREKAESMSAIDKFKFNADEWVERSADRRTQMSVKRADSAIDKLSEVLISKGLELGEFELFEFVNNLWDAAVEQSKEDQIFGPINEDYWFPLYLEAVFDGDVVVYNPNNEVMYKASFETSDGEDFTFSDAKEVRARLVYEEKSMTALTSVGHPKFAPVDEPEQTTKDAPEAADEESSESEAAPEDVQADEPDIEAGMDVEGDDDASEDVEDSEDAGADDDSDPEEDDDEGNEPDVDDAEDAGAEDDEAEVVDDDSDASDDSEDADGEEPEADVEDVSDEPEVDAEPEGDVVVDESVEAAPEAAPESVEASIESDTEKSTAAPIIEEMALKALAELMGIDADRDKMRRALSGLKFVSSPAVKHIDFDPEAAEQHLRRFCSEDNTGDKETMNWRKYAGLFAKVDGATKSFAAYSSPMFEVVDGDLTVVPKAVDEVISAFKAGDLQMTEADKRRVQTAHKMYAHGNPFDLSAEEAHRTETNTKIVGIEDSLKALEAAIETNKDVTTALEDLKKAQADMDKLHNDLVKSQAEAMEEMAKRLEHLEKQSGVSQQVAAGDGDPKTKSGKTPLQKHMSGLISGGFNRK